MRLGQLGLTTATCDPASSSDSVSARLLYCCGNSITISLLGFFPVRPCMVPPEPGARGRVKS